MKFDLLERPISEVFDEHEPMSAEVLTIQRDSEQDSGFIRHVRRCIHRTRPAPRKGSRMASLHGCPP